MGYPVTDVLRDAAGSLGYAAMVLEAGENSRMKAAERDLGEAEAIVVDMLAALEDAYQYMLDYKACQNQGLLDDMQAAIAKAKGD